MRADRLGSYSMWATLAGMPSLLRRKSIRRNRRLLPPPWWRTVTRPLLLRPARSRPLATSDFCGRSRVISSNPETLAPRRPGVVGLYFLIAMSLPRLEDLDLVARGESDDGPLLVGALSLHEPLALHLALARHRVDREDVDVPDLLDGLLDLGLAGIRGHEEGVLVRLQASVGLLRHDGADDDVPRALHDSSSSPSPALREPPRGESDGSLPSRTSRAAVVKSTWSAATTS